MSLNLRLNKQILVKLCNSIVAFISYYNVLHPIFVTLKNLVEMLPFKCSNVGHLRIGNQVMNNTYLCCIQCETLWGLCGQWALIILIW